MIEGREFVIPEDIKTVAIPVLAHRISITGTIATTGEQNKLMNELLNTIEVPTEDWSRR
jgi:MoxR-like ATPase